MISSKYISKIAISLISTALVLCVLAMCFYDKLLPFVNTSGYSMEYQKKIFDTSEIIDINIIIDDAKWNEMLQNARQEQYYECDVVINGSTFKQVGIRPKGNTSLSAIANNPDNDRYSFKLEFDHFIDGQTCFGLDKLILNNGYADTTNVKEAIIYDMFQFLDAEASLYNYAKISLNDEYWGVYLALEAVEDSFMLRNYSMEKGYLYKPDGMNFGGNGGQGMPSPPGLERNNREQNGEMQNTNEKQRAFNREGFDDNERGRRGGFGSNSGGSNLNYTDDNLDSYQAIWSSDVNNSTKADHKRVVEALKNVHRQADIEKYIDVEQVLKYMVVHNFSVNDDSLSGSMAHNYYLYEANGQISILPWDYNLAFGGMRGENGTSIVNAPVDEPWQGTRLFDFVLENKEYKARYHEYYNKLVNKYLYGGEFLKTYNRIKVQIDELMKSDPNSMYTYEEYKKGTDILYDVITLRTESVKGQLNGTIPSTSESQKTDSSKLVDASHINPSELGQLKMGGFGGDKDMKYQILKRNNQNQTNK